MENDTRKNRTNKSSNAASFIVVARKFKLPLFVIFCWAVFAAFGFYFAAPKVSGGEASGEITGAGLDSTLNVAENVAADGLNAFNGAPDSSGNGDSAEIEFSPGHGSGESSFNSQNFARFSHTNQSHASVSCLLCHQRTDNSPRPRLPGHSPCIGCHTQEFNNAAGSQICLVCHTSVGSSSLKPFPRLRSFNAKFSHAVHTRRGAAPRQGCAACHAPTQRGVARSIPAGFNAHTTCFQCHTSRAQGGGRDISSCATCHSLGRLTPVSDGSRAYRLNFSHSGHASVNCSECHQVRAGAARGNQVSETTPAMHFPPARAQSCASCHNNRRAFGGNDFSDCRRCHRGNSFGF